MAANPEPPSAIAVDELRALETSILKTLCLTINTAGSELKYKVLDSLSEDDFYFPVLRGVFRTLSDMHARGDYVISANLGEELASQGVELPREFSIDELFDGSLPSLGELTTWLARLKDRSRNGVVPTVKPQGSGPPATPPPQAHETVVRSVEEVRRKIAEEHRKSSPSVRKPPSSPSVATPPAAERRAARPSPPASSPRVRSAPAIEPPRPAPSASPAPKAPPSPSPAALSSEGDEWTSYLDELAAKQGKSIDTGFARLDQDLGGLAPGLVLLVDEDPQRLFSFLKQVTDQVASRDDTRCLYLATKLTKTALRIRTLARLASVPAEDLERGRLKRESDELRRVEAVGRSSGEWLRRVFVYEVQGELGLALARDLVKKLLESANGAACLVVVDALDGLASNGGAGAALSGLQDLAKSMDVLVLAGTSDSTLLSAKQADYAGVFREDGGKVELQVLPSSGESPSRVGFAFDRRTCTFTPE